MEWQHNRAKEFCARTVTPVQCQPGHHCFVVHRGSRSITVFSLVAIACIAVLSPWQGVTAEERRLDSEPKQSFTYDDGRKGAVQISVNNNSIIQGRSLVCTISLINHSEQPLPVFDPALTGIAGVYVKLGLFDRHGHYICDLLDQTHGGSSVIFPGHLMWCQIASKGIYDIKTRVAPKVKDRHGSRALLPPGQYHIQLIVNRRFFSKSPWELPYYDCELSKSSEAFATFKRHIQEHATALQQTKSLTERREEWAKAYPSDELVRSNVVTIHLLPRPVEAPRP